MLFCASYFHTFHRKIYIRVMKAKLLLVIICSFSLLSPLTIAHQAPTAKKFELTIDSIMRGPRLVGYAPTNPYWSQDSQKIYFHWKQAGRRARGPA